MSAIVRWEDPPPAHQPRNSARSRIVAELQAHPGEWALVSEDASGSLIGGLKGEPWCEVTTRRTGRVVALYARWLD